MDEELQLPELTQVQLLDLKETPLKLAGVIVSIKATARRKNDYFLGPYWSNSSGFIEITKEDLLSAIDATHESGLMDYAGINQCSPKVKIAVLSRSSIDRIVNCRKTIWKSLLKGEKKRFQSVEDLISIYESSPNVEFVLKEEDQAIEAVWDGTEPVCRLQLKLDV